MIKSVTICLLVFLITACGSKQGNLNNTIGWKSIDTDDYTILFLKRNGLSSTDSSLLNAKRKLDNLILEKLRTNKLGDQAENDDQTETDLHFLVGKNYEKALTAIIFITRHYKIEQDLIIYQREYTSFDKWSDKVIYSLKK